jgi:plasmid maintenance system antidote protein VapI
VPIHIGSLIRKEVERKQITYKEFGALIHRNEKTIPDIFERASMSTDLLISISQALYTDFLTVYYNEEPLKSLRNDEGTKQIHSLTEEIKLLQKELNLTQELVKSQKDTIAIAKEQIELYKIKLAGVSTV